MIEMLHDFRYQNPSSSGSIVYIMSCGTFDINSSNTVVGPCCITSTSESLSGQQGNVACLGRKHRTKNPSVCDASIRACIYKQMNLHACVYRCMRMCICIDVHTHACELYVCENHIYVNVNLNIHANVK